MKKFYDCNNCENTICKGDKMTVANNVIRHLPCRGWKKPEPMKTSLLQIAMEHKGCGTVVNKLFKEFKINFSEQNEYPYFRLTY